MLLRRSFAILTTALAMSFAGAVSSALADGVAALEDLPRSFAGTLPCADCPGIDWRLDLLDDGSFQLRRTYQDRAPGNVSDALGRWALGSDGRSLALWSDDDQPLFFAIDGKERLTLLDGDAHPIDSAFNHTLEAAALPLLEPELVMRGMYRYMADAARFTECSTGRSLPVAAAGDNVALERAYLAAIAEHGIEPGGEILVQLRGRIAMLPPMEGDGLEAQLEPVAFIATKPDETCLEPFAQAQLRETVWVLKSLADEPISLEKGQNPPNITFFADQPRFAGFGGCNRLIGGYAAHGDQLRFAAVAGTLMACVQGMELEAGLLEALEETDRFRILGQTLDLYADDNRPLARFVVGEEE